MKKYLWLSAALIAAFSLVFVVSSCGGGGDSDVELTGVTITSTWDKIGITQEFIVSASAAPGNATFANADVSWTSSDDTKATVTKSTTGNGLTATVRGIAAGKDVTITVSVMGKSDFVTIEVTTEAQNEPEPPEDTPFAGTGMYDPEADLLIDWDTSQQKDVFNGWGGIMSYVSWARYGDATLCGTIAGYKYLVLECKEEIAADDAVIIIDVVWENIPLSKKDNVAAGKNFYIDISSLTASDFTVSDPDHSNSPMIGVASWQTDKIDSSFCYVFLTNNEAAAGYGATKDN